MQAGRRLWQAMPPADAPRYGPLITLLLQVSLCVFQLTRVANLAAISFLLGAVDLRVVSAWADSSIASRLTATGQLGLGIGVSLPGCDERCRFARRSGNLSKPSLGGIQRQIRFVQSGKPENGSVMEASWDKLNRIIPRVCSMDNTRYPRKMEH